MTLASAALRSMLTQNVEVGLALNGLEVQVDGYQRQRVPSARWQVNGNRASVTVRFGPLAVPVDYDAGLVFVNGQAEQLLPNDGGEVGRIPPRATLLYETVIFGWDARTGD